MGITQALPEYVITAYLQSSEWLIIRLLMVSGVFSKSLRPVALVKQCFKTAVMVGSTSPEDDGGRAFTASRWTAGVGRPAAAP